MPNNEKQLFKAAAILYLVLLVLIYFGSLLRYLLRYSWYGSASVIIIIFIWITIFIIATVITARAVFLMKKRDETKQKLDFAAKLGVHIAEQRQSGEEPNLLDFYKKICIESGINKPPDLQKYYDNQQKLTEKSDLIYLKLKEEIESTFKVS